jgi:hypothetical protein
MEFTVIAEAEEPAGIVTRWEATRWYTGSHHHRLQNLRATVFTKNGTDLKESERYELTIEEELDMRPSLFQILNQVGSFPRDETGEDKLELERVLKESRTAHWQIFPCHADGAGRLPIHFGRHVSEKRKSATPWEYPKFKWTTSERLAGNAHNIDIWIATLESRCLLLRDKLRYYGDSDALDIPAMTGIAIVYALFLQNFERAIDLWSELLECPNYVSGDSSRPDLSSH